jgi:hydrogenase maturation protease
LVRLVLGCGNPDRGDDAAGPLAAERLRAMGVHAQEHSGEGLSLIERWRGCDEVILVDAVITGQPPGTLTFWDAREAPPPREALPCSTHAFGVAEAVELARALGRLPLRMRVCGIEAREFEPGRAPGAAVLEGVERAARLIAAEWLINA